MHFSPHSSPVSPPLPHALCPFWAPPQLLWSSGLACILTAAFAFAWAASFVKLAKRTQPALSIYEIIFVRSLISITASVAAARGRPPLGRLRHAHLLALRGLLGTTAMALFYSALVRQAGVPP